jgi:preprotein translocase YajC subunit
MLSTAWARRARRLVPFTFALAALLAAPALVAADNVTGPTAPVGTDPSATPPPTLMGSPYFMLVVLGGMMLFMFITSSRTTKAEAAKKQALFDSLKPGMRVVTTFGLIAEIERLGTQGDTIWLLQGEGKNAVAVEYLRTAIASKYDPTPAATADKNGKAK